MDGWRRKERGGGGEKRQKPKAVSVQRKRTPVMETRFIGGIRGRNGWGKMWRGNNPNVEGNVRNSNPPRGAKRDT